MNNQNSSARIFDLDRADSQLSSSSGSRTTMNAGNFPILKEMGASILRLEKGGVHEPHWHPNAAELNYCIAGNAKMTIYSSNVHKDTFTINPGQLTFIPKSSWHDVENIGKEELKIISVYDNDQPEELGISGSVGSLPTRVLNSIFGINSPGFFDQLNYKSPKDVVFGTNRISVTTDGNTGIDSTNKLNSHTINLGDMNPQLQTSGGTAKLGSAPYFPILKGLSVFLIDLKPKGIIEPHTHPNAGELNYVLEGKVRFTIYSPNQRVETAEISKGQVFFIPSGYFHYLENSDETNSGTVASFFGNENPEFIGLVGGLSSYSDEVLGSVFNKDSKFFNNLPRQVKNVLIAAGTD